METTPLLRDALRSHFRVGSAIDLRDLHAGPAALLDHFDSITAENAMKPMWAQPCEGDFRFDAADAIAEAAIAHGARVYGHTLVWHHQTPDWFFRDEGGSWLTDSAADRRLLRTRMEHHITTMAEHFGERVWAWEVVNEAVDPEQDDLLRRTPWYRVLGPGYVAEAFRIARDAAPHAMLVLNDFETEFAEKAEAVARVAERLLDDGVPVDALGHQAHLVLERPVAGLESAMTRFGELPVRQVVTELDVSVSRHPEESEAFPAPDRLVAQADYYAELFEAFRAHARELELVTIWGLFDGHSWLRYWPVVRLHEAPLLFDDLLRPKEPFWRIVREAGAFPMEHGPEVAAMK
jgi:endo-1,4-beta-xylanase